MIKEDQDDDKRETKQPQVTSTTSREYEEYLQSVIARLNEFRKSVDAQERVQSLVHSIEQELKEINSQTTLVVDNLDSKLPITSSTAENANLPENTQQHMENETKSANAEITQVNKKNNNEENQKVETPRKYSQFMESFFPKPFSHRVKFDSEEALSYITPWKDAEEVASEMLHSVYQYTRRDPTHIIDGTGGLGGNTLGFLRYYWKNYSRSSTSLRTITMCELNSDRYKDALYNLNLYRGDQRGDWISFDPFNANFVTWWRQHRSMIDVDSTIVFMDPPWGGQDYKTHGIIEDLFLSVNEHTQISIRDFTNEILSEGVLAVILKVPHNYSDRTLTEGNNKRRLRTFIMKKVKYILIVKENESIPNISSNYSSHHSTSSRTSSSDSYDNSNYRRNNNRSDDRRGGSSYSSRYAPYPSHHQSNRSSGSGYIDSRHYRH